MRCECGAHGLCAFGVVVVIFLQDVREEEQLEYQEYYGEFDYDQYPEFATHCHGTETVHVHAHDLV